MLKSMLSTIDNPHNPFDDFAAWYAFDVAAGYHTSSFLARLVIGSDQLSLVDQNLVIEDAIDEAVRENVTGVYIKVTKEVEDSELHMSEG
jgi:hypothetical protein